MVGEDGVQVLAGRREGEEGRYRGAGLQDVEEEFVG